MTASELLARIRGDLSALETLNLAGAVIPAPVAPVIPAPVLAVPAAIMAAASSSFADEGAFYDYLRHNHMLGPVISSSEFQGTSAIVSACAGAGWGVGWTAIALGTAFLETAGTMQPIHEYGGAAYFTRRYDIRGNPEKARELGNLDPGDGPRYAGRGLVQTTGKRNYAHAETRLRELGILKPGESLVASPELALRPDIASAIMVYGMQEGWFTSRKLADYIAPGAEGALRQFRDSRRIINGTDRWDDLARYCVDWQQGLKAGGYRALR